MSNFEGREFGWEDSIEKDGVDFIILPEGDYEFEVTNFERARHPGSEKLPPCNKAIVHIRVEGKEGASTIIKHNLFLHSITEGMLCAFFTSIGQRKKGEKVNMNWCKVIGSKGRLKLSIRDWTADDGKKMQSNEIKKFYEPDDLPNSNTQGTGFQVGRF